MVLRIPYVLRTFFTDKYITANIVDRNRGGRIVATASSIERPLKNILESKRTCTAKAASVVGDVLAMRIKIVNIPQIYCNTQEEINKDVKNKTKIRALIDALRAHGVKVIDEDDGNI